VLTLPCTAPAGTPETALQPEAGKPQPLNFEDVGPII